MAWTTPGTAVAGTVYTSAFYNEQTRDNLNFLYEPPAAHAYTNATKSLTSGSWTTVSNLAAEDYDTDAMHDNSVNPERLTCKTAGIFLVILNISFAPNATGSRGAGIAVNSGTPSYVNFAIANVVGGAGSPAVSVSAIIKLNVNDYVAAYAFQDSGGALNISTRAAFLPGDFQAIWLGNP